jgi:parvulin-like peptidyl-prolyl isomerase
MICRCPEVRLPRVKPPAVCDKATAQRMTLVAFTLALSLTCAGLAPVRADDETPETKSPEEAQDKPAAAATGPPVAATVNDEPVYVAEVDALLQKLLKGRRPDAKGLASTRAEVLKQLVNQHLAMQMLRREGGYVNDSDVNKDIAKLKTAAQAQHLTLDQYAAKRKITVDALRHEFAWRRGWEKYIDVHLADALEGYFKEHHKDLDGTLVRASHILLRSERAGESSSQLKQRAAQLREEIESGKIKFEDAAKKYSAGPSRQNGGDLGFFPRNGVMVDAFAKAAFELDKGELSQPVSTPFGAHLILVTDIKPGTKQWTQVVDQIKAPASVDLFDKLVKKESEHAKIEFTGKVPYLNPDTGELVLPEGSTK